MNRIAAVIIVIALFPPALVLSWVFVTGLVLQAFWHLLKWAFE